MPLQEKLKYAVLAFKSLQLYIYERYQNCSKMNALSIQNMLTVITAFSMPLQVQLKDVILTTKILQQ